MRIDHKKRLSSETIQTLLSDAEWIIEQDLEIIEAELLISQDRHCAYDAKQLVGVAFTRRNVLQVANILYLIIHRDYCNDEVVHSLVDSAKNRGKPFHYLIGLSKCPELSGYYEDNAWSSKL